MHKAPTRNFTESRLDKRPGWTQNSGRKSQTKLTHPHSLPPLSKRFKRMFGGQLTAKRRRTGRRAARIGRSHTARYLWCRCILRDSGAASPAAHHTGPGRRRPTKPGASILCVSCTGIPFLLPRSSVRSLSLMQLTNNKYNKSSCNQNTPKKTKVH